MSISQSSSKRRRVNHREEEGKSEEEEDMDFDLGEALRIVDEELQKEKESKEGEAGEDVITLNPKKRSFSAAFT